jgi:uncharacterized membrane protein YdbT with pleckstrin-like domain
MSNATSDGEEVLWSGSVSQWHYVGKWFVVILLVGGSIATFLSPFSTDETASWIIRGVLALGALILLIWIIFDRSKRKYAVTNKRVSVEYGIISKTSNEIRIQDIRSINLTMKGLPGFAGIGRLEFSSAATDDAEVVFWNVPGAEKLRDMVRSLQS